MLRRTFLGLLMAIPGLAAILAAGKALAESDQASALSRVLWTPPQHAFLMSVLRVLLLRAGNQWLGKSYVGIADTIMRCDGSHPVDKRGHRPGGIIAIVASPSDGHSVQIQGKAWELVNKEDLVPGQHYDATKGFKGRRPALKFRNGSIIHFRSFGQGALNLSGITADHVQIDELCSEGVYNELTMRVVRRGGTVRLTLTPINAPAEWLRKRVESGDIPELHFRCEPRHCIPMGSQEPLRDPVTGQPQDEQWVADYIAQTPEDQREVRCHGEWLRSEHNRELAGWQDAYVWREPQYEGNRHVSGDEWPVFAEYGIGIDYGEGAGRTVAILCGNSIRDGVLAIDEWCGDGATPIEEVARGIRRMVERIGLRLDQVHRIVGDINNARVYGQVGSMNDTLEKAFVRIEAESGRRLPPRWRIEKPFKPRGSVDMRMRLLNEGLSNRRIRVSERCNRLLTSMRTYQRGLRNSLVLKDPLDAFNYCAEPWLTDETPQPRQDYTAIRRR